MIDFNYDVKRKIELKYFFWAFFYFHLALYIAANALLITSNFMVSPNQWWFVIPLASWGVFLLGHFLITFFLIAESSQKWRASHIAKVKAECECLNISEQEIRKKASVYYFFWMFFYIHFAIFIGGNTVMLMINLLLNPRELWFPIPFIGWGLWLLFHFFLTFVCLGEAVKDWRKRQIGKLLFEKVVSKENQRDAFLRFFFWNFFIAHLFLYVLCNMMMVGINLILNPDFIWFIWPLLAWGLFIFFHWGLTYVTSSPMMVKWREEQLKKHYEL